MCIKDFGQEQFKTWKNILLNGLANKDADLILEKTGKLLELDTSNDGLLKVHFSERLVVLLKEVRQLSELGYKVPKEISNATNNAQKYYQYALQLKQVASFYNTMGEQIIRCQSGLLLRQATAFEQVVKEAKNMKWNDNELVTEYMNRLMNAADILTSRNRKLRNIHTNIAHRVNKLMDIDMLRKRDEWKIEFNKIEAIFIKEEKIHSIDHISVWRQHWDQQLFKAFEIQYCFSLLSLARSKIEIPVNLIYTNKILTFKPSLEELRSKYYKNMIRILDAPRKFKGFNNSKLYQLIPKRNSKNMLLIYKNAEYIFKSLKLLLNKYRPYTMLGQINNLEQFVEQNLNEVHDWVLNFKLLKLKRKEILRLPDKEKIGIFNISFELFKASIEDQLHHLSDALMISLKRSCQHDITIFNDFINKSLIILNTRPHTIEEMSIAKEQWSTIQNQIQSISYIMHRIIEKNDLLRYSVNISLDINHINSDWEQFQISFEAFNDMLLDQKEIMINNIKNANEIVINITKFSSRWSALKPDIDNKEMKLTNKMASNIFNQINDWQIELNTIYEAINKVQNNAKHFDLQLANFNDIDVIAQDINTAKASWTLYKNFSDELNLMINEDWFSFRTRIFDFEDFLK